MTNVIEKPKQPSQTLDNCASGDVFACLIVQNLFVFFFYYTLHKVEEVWPACSLWGEGEVGEEGRGVGGGGGERGGCCPPLCSIMTG